MIIVASLLDVPTAYDRERMLERDAHHRKVILRLFGFPRRFASSPLVDNAAITVFVAVRREESGVTTPLNEAASRRL
ncbi:MAG: hypothetical protein ACREJ3_20470 [Polyangiaceae bacterium]